MRGDSDVVVVGSGLIGLSLALSLANRDFRVRLISQDRVPVQPPEAVSLRVSAIASAGRELLTELEAWSQIPSKHRYAFSHMRVWDANVRPRSDRELVFHSADLGFTELGHIVPNDWILATLGALVMSHPNIQFTEVTALDAIKANAKEVTAQCTDMNGETKIFRAQLVVGADGVRSQVRELSQIATMSKSYAQRGVVCTVRSEHSHEDTAWQRFLATGPLAFLPLDATSCSIVWSADEPLAASLMASSMQAFTEQLQIASDGVLGELQVTSSRAAFPLSLQSARAYTASRVALVGDAAHVVHPLAGQGANLGFGDVIALVAALEAGRARGDSAGDRWALRRFERARKYENRLMAGVLDGLQRLFANQQGWLVGSRTVGMSMLNQFPALKSQVARAAFGQVE